MIQAILFDCDGVLMDTERMANEINAELLQLAGIPMTYDDCRQHLTGRTEMGVRQYIAENFAGKGPDWDAESQKWNARFRQQVQETQPVMPGAVRMLEALTLPYAVVTNAGFDDMNFKFDVTPLGPFFNPELRFSGQALNMPKPDPGAYLAAARKLGIAPQHCVVVEDSVIGVQAGLNAGMQVWGFTADANETTLLTAGAHRCFNHLDQLIGLVDYTNNTKMTGVAG